MLSKRTLKKNVEQKSFEIKRTMRYVDVILPLPLDGLFTYTLPDALEDKVQAGMRVLVPLGRSKTYTAMVLRLHDQEPAFKTREVLQVLDTQPMLLAEQMRLWLWVADYYMSPLGDVFKTALPPGLKSEDGYRPRKEAYVALGENYRSEQALHIALSMLRKGLKQHQTFITYLSLSHWDTIEGTATAEPVVEITKEELMNESHCSAAVLKALLDRKLLYTYEREVGRLNDGGEEHRENIKRLNDAQEDAYNKIVVQMMRKNVVLLHGVTSSGKTEIYIHLIDKALSEGKQVLYLLPEIALTVQTTTRLRHVFGDRLGIYHSKYSDAERVEIWKKQLSDTPYDIILGARSAVWLPFQRLGLVIIDEEHESSFKQQDPAPRYHARSAAIVLASMYGAKTLLGTATPSAESYYNATTGKYGLVKLTTRYKGIELPEIRVVNVKDLRHRKIMRGPFSPDLLAAMRQALDEKKQVILFQNRRGFAPMVECNVCGWVPKCKNCDVSLTLHKNTNLMTCHYCGYTYAVPKMCPNCESTDLRSRGFGTEKIEDLISELFPEARVARMDLDTTRTRNAYERLIGEFSAGKTDILIGTQMISKGLDFDNVSVVGILDADGMLSQPDFRSHERAFQMMEQVAGRAGRKGGQGHVILQTRDAQSPVVQQVVAHDYQAMYEAQMQERELFNYPPLCRLVSVYVKHRDERTADALGRDMAQLARRTFGERVLGPDTPPIGRIQLMYIRKVLVKIELTASMSQARDYLRQIQRYLLALPQYKGAQVYYDVD